MIKVIFFDYFGVVSSDDYWVFSGEAKQKLGTFHELANKVNLGEINWQKFVKEFSENSGKSEEDINTMYASQTINRELVGLIRKLSEKYQIGLLTNAHHDYIRRIIKKSGLDTLFDPIVISSEVGFIKPSKEIFTIAAEKAGVALSQVMVIDDIQINVDGAKLIGADSLLFSSVDQLTSDLVKLNLLDVSV